MKLDKEAMGYAVRALDQAAQNLGEATYYTDSAEIREGLVNILKTLNEVRIKLEKYMQEVQG
jgi:hypothetical protein